MVVEVAVEAMETVINPADIKAINGMVEIINRVATIAKAAVMLIVTIVAMEVVVDLGKILLNILLANSIFFKKNRKSLNHYVNRGNCKYSVSTIFYSCVIYY